MQISVNVRGQILTRFGNQLAALGDGKARLVMARALNHEGDKGRTQVKRALVRQTGIKYGMIDKAMRSIEANSNSLTYTLEAKGDETNLNLFGARQGKKGVSAAPWNQRRVFKSSFIIQGYGGKVYRRTSKARFPIKPLYGPNIARELVKGETAETFQSGVGNIADRVAHEIARELPA